MSKLGYTLRIVRVPVLVALLLLDKPLFDRFLPAVQRLKMEPLRWNWTALVALAVVFLVVALVARQRRQPPWLLGVEAVIAGVIGVIMPAWGVWVAMRPDGVGLPGVLQPLADALGRNPVQSGGFGLAMNWFVLVLTLAWMVIVVESALRQVRQGRASRRSQQQPSN